LGGIHHFNGGGFDKNTENFVEGLVASENFPIVEITQKLGVRWGTFRLGRESAQTPPR